MEEFTYYVFGTNVVAHISDLLDTGGDIPPM
jgi:hypothetical protein